MTRSTAALLAPVLAGCSLIYNPNNLPAPLIDAPGMVDAALPPDANESLLTLTDISPQVINEGQGDAGSVPVLFVVRGSNLVSTMLKVELVPPQGKTVLIDPVTDAVASQDLGYIAFTAIARVDEGLTADVAL